MNRTGIALVTALAVMALAALLAFGLFFTTQIEEWVTRNEVTAARAYYAAHAGLQKYKTALFQNFRWALGNVSPTNLEACQNILAGGIYWDRNPTGSPSPFPMKFKESFPDGSWAEVTISQASIPQGVDVSRESSIALLVESVGGYGAAKSTVRAMVILTDASQWNYALFSRQAYSGKTAGSAAIHGGLYIEGDPNNLLPPSEPALQQTGSTGVFNTYDLSKNYSDVLSKPKVGNLCASLRVRYGWIIMEGASSLGTKDAPLISVAVGSPDAKAGDANKDSPLIYKCPGNNYERCDLVNKASIHALGKVGRFDLMDPPVFPELGSSDCTSSNSLRCQIRKEAQEKGLRVEYGSPPTLSFPRGAIWNNKDPNNTDPSQPPQSCREALANQTLSLGLRAIDCTYSKDGVNPAGGFRYSPGNPGTLEVFGTVDLIGYNLEVAKSIVYKAYSFSQSGYGASIVVEKAGSSGGDISIKGSVKPDASFRKFPDQVLGLIAEGNIRQWKNTEVFASLYAGNEYRMSEKGSGAQTTLVGNVIANQFCVSAEKGMDESTCVPGSGAAIYFVDTSSNRSAVLVKMVPDQKPTFQIVMYERK